MPRPSTAEVRRGAPALWRWVAAAFLAAAILSTSAPSVLAQDEDYRLASGDRVRVNVFGEPELTGEYELDGGGVFSMPLIGTVPADALTVRELEARIDGMLRGDYLVNPQISVEVLNYRPFYILGEVNEPGSYAYRAGMTVINAVALAGGYTFRADQDDIEIRRGGDTQQTLEAREQTKVLPGDIVEVKERFF